MKIQLKRSNVLEGSVAKAPTPAQMEYGELAVNYNVGDPVIFLKDSDNNIVRITNTNVPDLDNDLGGVLATGFTYYLSAVKAGNWTITPDTTTPGAVVIQCGVANDTNQMLVEIQPATEV